MPVVITTQDKANHLYQVVTNPSFL